MVAIHVKASTLDLSRILVTSKGHLGSFLVRRWGTHSRLHWTGRIERLDATTLRGLNPIAVVNAAGKTDLPWCEQNPGEAFQCNTLAPLGLYRAVREAFGGRVPFIHVSSGCLWDGPFHAEGRPFRPTDPVKPACHYSWTKAAGDAMLLHEADSPLAILRPRQLFSDLDSPRNTLLKLKGYPALLDTPNSMTSADTVACTVEALLQKNAMEIGQVLNVYDLGITSPFRVGELMAEADLREAPKRLQKSELDAWHKPKRVDTVLEDPYFEALVQPNDVETQLRASIHALAQRLSPASLLAAV